MQLRGNACGVVQKGGVATARAETGVASQPGRQGAWRRMAPHCCCRKPRAAALAMNLLTYGDDAQRDEAVLYGLEVGAGAQAPQALPQRGQQEDGEGHHRRQQLQKV